MKRSHKIIIWVSAVLAVLTGAAGYVLGMYYIDNKQPNCRSEQVLSDQGVSSAASRRWKSLQI